MIPLGIFLASFGYYGLLSAKQYTWLFASQDSGDWLAASTIWFVPQPLGSPLYILLGHFLNLFPGDLPIKMTIALSCLPSAITVTLVYLILSKMVSKQIALAGSLVLLGSAVFLSQSTILEEYALSAMLLTLAYWFYLRNQKKLSLLALGLGASVHIIILVIALIWLVVERADWREWLKSSWAFFLPLSLYLMIPVMMLVKTPPYMAGYFSFSNIYEYLFQSSGAVVGQISVYDFPIRAGTVVGFLAISLGLAIVPSIMGLSKPWSRGKWILIVSAMFPVLYYLLCLDPSTWTFLTMGLPFIVILAGIGLSKLQAVHLRLVVTGAIALILVNGVFLNADVLARAEPVAVEVEEELKALPSGSAVLVIPGDYSMAMLYVIAQGYDLMPIIWKDFSASGWPKDTSVFEGAYLDYAEHIYVPKGISSILPFDVVLEIAEEFDSFYIAATTWQLDEVKGVLTPWTTMVTEVLDMEGNGRIREIKNILACYP